MESILTEAPALQVAIGVAAIAAGTAYLYFQNRSSNNKIDDSKITLSAKPVSQLAFLTREKKNKFNEDRHGNMLDELWRLLKPTQPRLNGRFTEEWGLIGFQGHDPVTDFRAMGVLALRIICHMSRHYPEQAQSIIKRDQDRDYDYYPFAIGCINVAAALLKFINQVADDDSASKQSKAAIYNLNWLQRPVCTKGCCQINGDNNISNDNKDAAYDSKDIQDGDNDNSLAVFGDLFSRIMIEFDRFYVKEIQVYLQSPGAVPALCVMQFNSIHDKFRAHMKDQFDKCGWKWLPEARLPV